MPIKEKREQKGLTQQQIAQALHIDQSTVCLWESGKTKPRAKLLPSLARLLGCTIDDLLCEDADLASTE